MKACIALLVSLFALSVVGQSLYTDSPSYFFPFGEFNGDTVWDSRGDDDHTPLISFPFGFYDEVETKLYVSSNGYLTFREGDYTYVPDLQSRGLPTVAPFFTDLASSSHGGFVSYRVVEDNTTKSLGQNLIRTAFKRPTFELESMFVATWDGVKAYSNDFSWYTFQVALIASCDQSFVVFNYGDLELSYETSDEEGEEPSYDIQVGYSSGDEAADYFVHPDSNKADILELNKGSNLAVNGAPLIGQYAYLVYTAPPVTPVLLTPADRGYSVASPVVTGTAYCRTKVEVEIDGKLWASTYSDNKGNFLIKNGPEVEVGIHTVSATTEDGATETHTFKTKSDAPLKFGGGGEGNKVFYEL